MPQLTKSLTTKKTFNYSHGTVSLNFTLDISNKSEFTSFKKCLVEAIKDIDRDIK